MRLRLAAAFSRGLTFPVSHFVRLLALPFRVRLLFCWIVSHTPSTCLASDPRDIRPVPIPTLVTFDERSSGFPPSVRSRLKESPRCCRGRYGRFPLSLFCLRGPCVAGKQQKSATTISTGKLHPLGAAAIGRCNRYHAHALERGASGRGVSSVQEAKLRRSE